MNKYEKIIEWFDDYNPLSPWTYFNVVPVELDNVSINSVTNERLLEQYINGDRLVELLFSITLMKEYDTNTTDINVLAIREFEKISEWIEQQQDNGVYPEFGDNYTIQKVESLQNAPMVSIDTDLSLAKYLGQFKITYIERS